MVMLTQERWQGWRWIMVGIVVLVVVGCQNNPSNERGESAEKAFGPLVFGQTLADQSREANQSSAANDPTASPEPASRGVLDRLFSRDEEPNPDPAIALRANPTLPNAYLWQGAVAVVGVMPLRQFDRNTGIIVTDWYEEPEGEARNDGRHRFRLNVFITTPTFRAQGVRVVAFQERWSDEEWVAIETEDAVALAIADQILREANNLRLSTVAPYDAQTAR